MITLQHIGFSRTHSIIKLFKYRRGLNKIKEKLLFKFLKIMSLNRYV